MKNKLNRIITEVINKFIINETAGVNFDILQASKEIATDFIQNHLWDIYDEYSSREMDWNMEHMDDDEYDDIDNPWYDLDYCYNFESNNKTYRINIVYINTNGGSLHGQASEWAIDLNYCPLKDIIESSTEHLGGKANKEQIEDYVNSTIYEKLVPIIEHELTHTLDDRVGELDDTWLSREPHRSIPREDIFNAIYLYSEKEMNARIGSVGALFQNLLEMYDDEQLQMISHNSDYFQSLVEELLDDESRELRIHEMRLVLSQIADYKDINEKPKGYPKDYLKRTNGVPYSYAYYMFKNDSRIKKNRNIKHLFETNFPYGEKAVWNFYKNVFDIYIKRIYKACYASLINKIREYEKS